MRARSSCGERERETVYGHRPTIGGRSTGRPSPVTRGVQDWPLGLPALREVLHAPGLGGGCAGYGSSRGRRAMGGRSEGARRRPGGIGG
eukprot:4306841-Pyramimonas_sp.AAC.2